MAARATSSRVARSKLPANRRKEPRAAKESKGNTYGSYRSKYELEVATNLETQNIAFEYESVPIEYLQPVIKGTCPSCGSCKVAQRRTYTPDFALKNATDNVAFFIETKGLFTSENRRTMALVKQQHPEIDIRMLFMRNNKVHKNNPKTYGDWCNEQGIKWAVGKEAPAHWLKELCEEVDGCSE